MSAWRKIKKAKIQTNLNEIFSSVRLYSQHKTNLDGFLAYAFKDGKQSKYTKIVSEGKEIISENK